MKTGKDVLKFIKDNDVKYVDFRFTDMGWQETYPNLERLYGKLMQRASFAETLPHD